MPLRDFMCNSCAHQFEEIVDSMQTLIMCPHCETETAESLPSLIGGYTGSMGGSSTRPKNSTAMKKSKVFTGNTEDKGQMEFNFEKKDV